MSDLKRKIPRQSRARKTLETLLEATAQILATEGSERLTTNYVAQKAGYSIGTVYQYFPNREAIVLGLIERQREQVRQQIAIVLDVEGDATPERQIRSIIQVLHRAFARHRLPERRLVQALTRHALANGLPAVPDTAVQAILEVWQGRGADARPLDESEVFVLSGGLVETLRRATLQGFTRLGTEQFEDALARMVMGFLNASTPMFADVEHGK
ncbi:TetR/AcrR family transcriptional regulator [Paraburkholderia sp. J41]|uniref:TetR/AcrR family transcriptional regulator n=1 Tax=Paraburkholderia sp. J41 TaxID=2805433 RepID=UPI002AC34D53|nr:TetR/AcrR family transcriptional regulator [Paraburkholderia sp. J41]